MAYELNGYLGAQFFKSRALVGGIHNMSDIKKWCESRNLISLLLIILLATTLVSRSIFNAVLILLAGLAIFLIQKQELKYYVQKYSFFLLPLLGISLSAAISFFVNIAPELSLSALKKLDVTSRFILLIPILFVLDRSKLSQTTILLGFFLGSVLAGSVAVYQVFVKHLALAVGDAGHHIVFGSISAIFAMGALLLCSQKQMLFKFMGSVGFIFGLT